MRYLACLLSLGIVLLSGCDGGPPSPPEVHYFSFENDWEGWTVKGTDLNMGDGSGPPINWSVERTQERAFDGTTSVKFYLENFNDAGKIWIERSFPVKSNRTYRATVEYASVPLVTRDQIATFKIITGVLPAAPQTREDLLGCFFDPAGNGQPAAENPEWVNRRFEFTVRSNSAGDLYVVIGMWGVWESFMGLWVDGVRVNLAEV